MSFFYGYKEKHDIETIGGLATTGGEMTGDINMNDNHILTSADPTENSHLARKTYGMTKYQMRLFLEIFFQKQEEV